MAEGTRQVRHYHECKICGAVTRSELVGRLLDLAEARLNEQAHRLLILELRLEIADKMLKEAAAYLGNEQLFKRAAGTTTDDMVVTQAKLLHDRIHLILEEFKK